MELERLTWKCHICGEERPDNKISVLTKPLIVNKIAPYCQQNSPLIVNGQVCGQQNIRYCNDRRACILGAKDFSFFKAREVA